MGKGFSRLGITAGITPINRGHYILGLQRILLNKLREAGVELARKKYSLFLKMDGDGNNTPWTLSQEQEYIGSYDGQDWQVKMYGKWISGEHEEAISEFYMQRQDSEEFHPTQLSEIEKIVTNVFENYRPKSRDYQPFEITYRDNI